MIQTMSPRFGLKVNLLMVKPDPSRWIQIRLQFPQRVLGSITGGLRYAIIYVANQVANQSTTDVLTQVEKHVTWTWDVWRTKESQSVLAKYTLR